MGDNNLSTVVEGTRGVVSQVNQYKTALSGDQVPRGTDGVKSDRQDSIGTDSNRFKDLNMHGIARNKGEKLMPAGMMMPYAGSSAPADWLLCNGDTIGNASSGATHAGDEYEDLFNVVKASWGNTGSEVFADDDTVVIPDFTNGEFMRGVGGSSAALGVSQSSQNLTHNHNGSVTLTGYDSGGSPTTGGDDLAGWDLGESDTLTSTITTPSSGGSEARPLNKAVNYLIRI